jgi:exodeoxyribonuclease VII large subunit
MKNNTEYPVQQKIYTVTQLNRETSLLLADHFFTILVEGEISNLSTPSSGHIYFSLKDANAQVRCAMFKSNKRRHINNTLENGNQVLIKAQVSLYEPRGDYQLIVEQIEAAGEGQLRKAFEALKQKLLSEGLFNSEYKQSLPVIPHTIGVITSASGAALRDILTVLKRRFPCVPVIIYPTSVQGDNAKYEITKAIKTANQLQQCDVIILARGGGSLEDLWAFNEEIVARAIFASVIPIISGVGHETDVTIADFVADLRAPTPSAAAEHALPDQTQWLAKMLKIESTLIGQMHRKIAYHQQALTWIDKRLQQQHPKQKMTRNSQRIDELELRMTRAIQNRLSRQQQFLDGKLVKLGQFDPAIRIRQLSQRHAHLRQRLVSVINYKLEQLNQHLNNTGQTLHAISPLATLNRGYALTFKSDSDSIIKSTKDLTIGQTVRTRLGYGEFSSQIVAIDSY